MSSHIAEAELRGAGIAAILLKPIKQSRLLDCLVDVIGKSAAEKAFASSAKPRPSTLSPARRASLQ